MLHIYTRGTLSVEIMGVWVGFAMWNVSVWFYVLRTRALQAAAGDK